MSGISQVGDCRRIWTTKSNKLRCFGTYALNVAIEAIKAAIALRRQDMENLWNNMTRIMASIE